MKNILYFSYVTNSIKYNKKEASFQKIITQTQDKQCQAIWDKSNFGN